MNVSIVSSKETLVDQILNEVKLINQKEKVFTNLSNRIYRMDYEKSGNKKFIARQPSITKEHRDKSKELFKSYLNLKLSENIENNSEIDLNKQKGDIFRFKIKIDNCDSCWFELHKKIFGKYSFLSFEKNKKKEYLVLSGKETLLFQKGILNRIFNGNQLENIYLELPKEKKPEFYWSGWKTSVRDLYEEMACLPIRLQSCIYSVDKLFCSASPAWQEYQNIIHPALKKVSLEILKNSSHTCLNVVEICGGEGNLAIKIAKNSSKQLNYYLLDINERSLQQAKKHILKENGKHISNIIPLKTDVTNEQDYFIDYNKQQSMKDNSMDLIIGSGALTSYVLDNKKTALKVAQKCYALLKRGGKMILAGHAHSLLNRADFTSMGFNVINSYLVGIQDDIFYTEPNEKIPPMTGFNKEFYILEK